MKPSLLLVLLLFVSAFAFGQGSESFTNLTASGSSYTAGSYTGDGGLSWTYNECRSATSTYNITGRSAGFGSSGTRNIYTTVTGGVGEVTYSTRSYFTGGSASDRTIQVWVNGTMYESFTLGAMGTVYTRTVSGINETGAVVLEFRSTGSRQIIIDDVSWTGFTGSVTPTVGFDNATSSVAEGNSGTTNHTINVTMDVAPSSTVTVDVSNAGTGSATAGGTDYSFTSPSTLTFTTGASYPNTQTVTVVVVGETAMESDETVDLSLAVTTGTANTGTTSHTFTISDDDTPPPPGCADADSVFINELHYDNSGGDTNEGIEIAGRAGTDLTDYEVHFYNGSTGAQYGSGIGLYGSIDDEGSGFGAVWFGIAGIQNGNPDGIVLYNTATSTVVQFLSYGGTFTASGGVAGGMLSTDIGVNESSSTPVGQSLQLTGAGCCYSDFSWTGPTSHSRGDLNSGQSYSCAAATPTVGFDNATSSVTEGNSGTTNHTISITMDIAPTSTVTVDVTDLASGSAISGGTDYTFASPTTLTFLTSDSYPYTQSITVVVVGETAVESDETVDLGLTVTSGSAITATTAHTFTITNDDAIIVGFDVTASNITEGDAGSASHSINVTMNQAPASTVIVDITDAGTGTASTGTDYDFTSPTQLTFLTGDTYPYTQTVTVTVYGDLVSEANETVDLNLAVTTGSSTTGNTSHTLTIIDNEIPSGLILNEFSQGASGQQEFVEFLVVGEPGTTVDIRGWIFDDNNGNFSNGAGSQLGIAAGYIAFSDHCTWEKVPVGSLIVFYNEDDANASMPADDPTDADLDYTYIIPMNGAGSTCSEASLYFEGNCDTPNVSLQVYPNVYPYPDWRSIGFRNDGDAVQLRRPDATFFQGISYGSKGNTSDCGGCELNQTNHPDYSTYGSDALYFAASGGNTVYFFDDTTGGADYRSLANWSTAAASSNETPGTWNSGENQGYIQGLRQLFDVANSSASYVCDLRPNEARFWLDSNDDIICWIRNNGSTDHGPTTATLSISDDATPGTGFQNSNLTYEPIFMSKELNISPSVTTGADYTVRIYVSDSELSDFAGYANTVLTAISGHPHSYTGAAIASRIDMFKVDGASTVSGATSDAEITDRVTPSIGTYGGYTYFEATFNSFSGFALGGDTDGPNTLPVELLSFFGKEGENRTVVLNWETAIEIDNDYFVVEYSADGSYFEPIGQVEGAGNTTQKTAYQLVHEMPASGMNYYRLKQVDLDGSYTYSHIAAVELDAPSYQLVSLAPVPMEDYLNLTLLNTEEGQITVSVYNMLGELVYQDALQIEEGLNTQTINTANWAEGVYAVQLDNGKTRSVHQILKQ